MENIEGIILFLIILVCFSIVLQNKGHTETNGVLLRYQFSQINYTAILFCTYFFNLLPDHENKSRTATVDVIFSFSLLLIVSLNNSQPIGHIPNCSEEIFTYRSLYKTVIWNNLSSQSSSLILKRNSVAFISSSNNRLHSNFPT